MRRPLGALYGCPDAAVGLVDGEEYEGRARGVLVGDAVGLQREGDVVDVGHQQVHLLHLRHRVQRCAALTQEQRRLDGRKTTSQQLGVEVRVRLGLASTI